MEPTMGVLEYSIWIGAGPTVVWDAYTDVDADREWGGGEKAGPLS